MVCKLNEVWRTLTHVLVFYEFNGTASCPYLSWGLKKLWLEP